MKQGWPTECAVGLEFFTGSDEQLLQALDQGALCMMPAAGPLAELDNKPDYKDALESADILLPDSSFMVMLHWLKAGRRIRRFSGYCLMRLLLTHKTLSVPGSSFWIMPSQEDAQKLTIWAARSALPLSSDEEVYVAGQYARCGPLEDPELLEHIAKRKPKYVIIGLGGGTQERLGVYLKNYLPAETSILCVGAAIGFFTGAQGHFPTWADGCYLGWFFRICNHPSIFLRRYIQALGLIKKMLWEDRS